MPILREKILDDNCWDLLTQVFKISLYFYEFHTSSVSLFLPCKTTVQFSNHNFLPPAQSCSNVPTQHLLLPHRD